MNVTSSEWPSLSSITCRLAQRTAYLQQELARRHSRYQHQDGPMLLPITGLQDSTVSKFFGNTLKPVKVLDSLFPSVQYKSFKTYNQLVKNIEMRHTDIYLKLISALANTWLASHTLRWSTHLRWRAELKLSEKRFHIILSGNLQKRKINCHQECNKHIMHTYLLVSISKTMIQFYSIVTVADSNYNQTHLQWQD